ncbi:MAG: 4-(cytidine 5'-diphospho)-2-C-methyl-D-erythritol kinase [Rhodothermaceae bacterium]|nr:4-(cytidine 5'-diphospho)-2-C-methyl-D-erythritol kinase [Rhodothermaceae bacterium]MYF63274.1 4-(cytidine 5'-diphospho)-2-C-methyl-D-erythritol kinase [Rhodothermaceae bacterium]MYI84301.1 4-(cytidine 5'-diphospho)-2-C-methyl-D-erythritol kinase [Rhodothermaceae bacterium]
MERHVTPRVPEYFNFIANSNVLSATAPAKINLGLCVLRKRTDGYHDLATVFHPIGWADTLTADYADAVSLTCTDATLPIDEENLVVRAARLLKASAGVDRGAVMHLTKVLPHGAGLGGGSSDAATALQILCRLWRLDCTATSLASLALYLGSDVPFFLRRCTAYAQGRGEMLSPLEDYRFPFSLAVVVNPVRISTAWAFRHVEVRETGRPDLAEVVHSNDLDRWRRELTNDFEGPVCSKWPVLSRTKSALLRAGASFASLTGTGSGVYGVFESHKCAEEAAQEAAARGCAIWCEAPS